MPDGQAGIAGDRMPSKRHRKDSSKPSHADKIRELERRGIRVDKSNEKAIARKYAAAKRERLPSSMLAKIPGKKNKQEEIAKELRQHGFRTTDTKVLVDRPRNRKREIVRGSRLKIHRGGVVSMRVKERADYVYGFTAKEKKQFAQNPELLISEITKRLRKSFPLLKARKVQVRLQWGAYQATKDFAPTYFTSKYFAAISPEDKRRDKKKAKPRLDKLTGVHFVVHVPKKRKKGKRKHGKGKRK